MDSTSVSQRNQEPHCLLFSQHLTSLDVSFPDAPSQNKEQVIPAEEQTTLGPVYSVAACTEVKRALELTPEFASIRRTSGKMLIITALLFTSMSTIQNTEETQEQLPSQSAGQERNRF